MWSVLTAPQYQRYALSALSVAPQGLDALPRISGPLTFGSLVSFVPRITLVTIADTIKAPCSRHPVKRVYATLAVLRLVLLLRLHRIICRKSFAVLLVQQAFALTISLYASRILACRFQRHARRFVKLSGCSAAQTACLRCATTMRSQPHMILLLAYLPGWYLQKRR